MANNPDPQLKAEIGLYARIEALLMSKHSARGWNPSTTADEVIDIMIDRGWRAGLTTITTLDELESLPVGTVLRLIGDDEDGDLPLIAQKSAGGWSFPGERRAESDRAVLHSLPAQILVLGGQARVNNRSEAERD